MASVVEIASQLVKGVLKNGTALFSHSCRLAQPQEDLSRLITRAIGSAILATRSPRLRMGAALVTSGVHWP
jgi:hypothetical protein